MLLNDTSLINLFVYYNNKHYFCSPKLDKMFEKERD